MRGVAQKNGQKTSPGARTAPKAAQTRPRPGAGNQLRQREMDQRRREEEEERESAARPAAVTRPPGLRLQRMCACHGSGGGCDQCRKKKQDPPLLRKATTDG